MKNLGERCCDEWLDAKCGISVMEELTVEIIRTLFAGLAFIFTLWAIRPAVLFVVRPFPKLLTAFGGFDPHLQDMLEKDEKVEVQVPNGESPSTSITIDSAKRDTRLTTSVVQSWLAEKAH